MPKKINGYNILTSLGSGAFGRTFRVKKGGAFYAMKVLKPEAMRTEIDRRRFQRECRALQKIASDHVVSYYDHGVFDDDGSETFYVVMDFVEGTDFQRRLRGRELPLPEAEIRSLLSHLILRNGVYRVRRSSCSTQLISSAGFVVLLPSGRSGSGSSRSVPASGPIWRDALFTRKKKGGGGAVRWGSTAAAAESTPGSAIKTGAGHGGAAHRVAPATAGLLEKIHRLFVQYEDRHEDQASRFATRCGTR